MTSNVASLHPTRPILVVDDDPANLLAVAVALEPLQRQVITMDGYETARWIRARERSKHLPIIFLTTYDHDGASVLRA